MDRLWKVHQVSLHGVHYRCMPTGRRQAMLSSNAGSMPVSNMLNCQQPFVAILEANAENAGIPAAEAHRMLLASTAALYVSALILGPPASSSCIRISAGGQLFAVRARKDSSRDRKQSWLPIAVLDALPRDQLDTLCCDGFLALRRDA